MYEIKIQQRKAYLNVNLVLKFKLSGLRKQQKYGRLISRLLRSELLFSEYKIQEK